jgi:hypothetical protein
MKAIDHVPILPDNAQLKLSIVNKAVELRSTLQVYDPPAA